MWCQKLGENSNFCLQEYLLGVYGVLCSSGDMTCSLMYSGILYKVIEYSVVALQLRGHKSSSLDITLLLLCVNVIPC